jgi:hypothetical protein
VPRTGRRKAELVLSDVEPETLLGWSRRPKSSQAPAVRSRIVLAFAEPAVNIQVAADLRVVPHIDQWNTDPKPFVWT